MLKKHWISFILVVLVILFIWDNSLQNDISSDGLSLKMTQWLSPILYKLGLTGDMWSLNRIVRKMAHVFEFAVLGGCLYVALHQFNREYAGLKVIFIGLEMCIRDRY